MDDHHDSVNSQFYSFGNEKQVSCYTPDVVVLRDAGPGTAHQAAS